MNILGVVVARGGSKRVPRKNIKEFLGKPLLAWTAETAKKSQSVKRWILSTENEEISAVGKKYGLEIPFKRPDELATDTAKAFDVLKHVAEWMKKNENQTYDWIVLLEPTSPGRQPFHIDEVVKIIKEKGDEITSVCGVSEALGNMSAFKSLKIKTDGTMARYYDEAPFLDLLKLRNQDVPVSYYINSAIYAFKVNNFFSVNPSLWGDKVYGYVMDDKYALDIDTPSDWIVAESKMRNLLLEIRN